MIYLDNGATSFPKPVSVRQAVARAMLTCANPGRGGHEAAEEAARTVYRCRETAADFFHCRPEQVVLTGSCTHGLNIAIRSLVKLGDRVIVSGFEHNAVMRPLYALGAQTVVAGRRLFDWRDTLECFRKELEKGADAAVFTHASNVFGYILPVEQMAKMCHDAGVPFILDAAQSAGMLPVDARMLGAAFIAMPGHKGLHGPMGTGLLLCGHKADPLLYGGTGSESIRKDMPDALPERLEAGTLNVAGAAGLTAGIRYVRTLTPERIFANAHRQTMRCARELENLGMQVFSGEHQGATVSFIPHMDCEEAAEKFARMGIALRAGLHCAPLAHESAGTLDTGTVRVSFGAEASDSQRTALLRAAARLTKV